ncbi:MAG TPA: hypothetical protein VFS20_24215 [Longimicrobium sp.]|nr:hypothetical protein [Longimicrobium sp.]
MYGVLGFALSLAVHVLSYAGIAAQEYVPAVWALHAAVFPLFFAFVFGWNRFQGHREAGWDELLRYVPRWVRIAFPVLFVYVLINFFYVTWQLPSAGELRTTTLLIQREEMYDARGFSGHWLLFYALPALFFLYVPRDARPAPSRPAV